MSVDDKQGNKQLLLCFKWATKFCLLKKKKKPAVKLKKKEKTAFPCCFNQVSLLSSPI